MERFVTYVSTVLFGLACFACDNPMEVATKASAHTSDTANSAAQAQASSPTPEPSEAAEEKRGSDPAKTDMYPLPGEGGFAQSEGSDDSSESDSEELTGELNLNDASREKLELLPGVGPATAERIESYRSKRRFEEVDDIKRIKGIGEKTFADLKPYLAVSGETTLSE